ncbi:MAG: lipase maturation factor family protein [Bacteroidetes bacterium]|nr:lipase maturation factor family protein [Bacteroidota bacterium]
MISSAGGGAPATGTNHSYWLTRFVILRLLGFIYAIAFAVAIDQSLPLFGSEGLTPASTYLNLISDRIGSTAGFLKLPSLFWLNHSDTTLMIAAWLGFLLSCFVIAGYANAWMMAALWVLYTSFANIGQEWYGYGWEIQLLETGFLAIFLCPLTDARPFPKRPPPLPIIILFRWLIFRIMLGSGLIKLRGDAIWTKATALYYHFETQPIPGPLSRWFHFLPKTILQTGVWFNWLAELIAPWFAFWPRIGRHIAGVIMVTLQIILILSGNLSFLNWLTIIPALACFDDGFWAKILPKPLVLRAIAAAEKAEPSRAMNTTAWVITLLVALLSINPILNMISPSQVMNTSYDPLNLVNTYGAFGSVGQERFNIVFEGTNDTTPDENAHWQAYSYKGLPVATNERPAQIAPYQLRLDWQLWFAAMSTPDDYPWTQALIQKLLKNDPKTLSLFAGNPFPDHPPRYIRAILYRYRFAPPGSPDFWQREKIGAPWIPPTTR